MTSLKMICLCVKQVVFQVNEYVHYVIVGLLILQEKFNGRIYLSVRS